MPSPTTILLVADSPQALRFRPVCRSVRASAYVVANHAAAGPTERAGGGPVALPSNICIRAVLTNGHTGHVPRAPGFFFLFEGPQLAVVKLFLN